MSKPDEQDIVAKGAYYRAVPHQVSQSYPHHHHYHEHEELDPYAHIVRVPVVHSEHEELDPYAHIVRVPVVHSEHEELHPYAHIARIPVVHSEHHQYEIDPEQITSQFGAPLTAIKDHFYTDHTLTHSSYPHSELYQEY